MIWDILCASEHPGDLGRAAFCMRFAVILLLEKADMLNER